MALASEILVVGSLSTQEMGNDIAETAQLPALSSKHVEPGETVEASGKPSPGAKPTRLDSWFEYFDGFKQSVNAPSSVGKLLMYASCAILTMPTMHHPFLTTFSYTIFVKNAISHKHLLHQVSLRSPRNSSKVCGFSARTLRMADTQRRVSLSRSVAKKKTRPNWGAWWGTGRGHNQTKRKEMKQKIDANWWYWIRIGMFLDDLGKFLIWILIWTRFWASISHLCNAVPGRFDRRPNLSPFLLVPSVPSTRSAPNRAWLRWSAGLRNVCRTWTRTTTPVGTPGPDLDASVVRAAEVDVEEDLVGRVDFAL